MITNYQTLYANETKLSRPQIQSYAFPSSFIYYIATTSTKTFNKKLRQKLMRCCKSFKILTHRFETIVCNDLRITSRLNNCVRNVAVKSIQVCNSVDIYCGEERAFKQFFEKWNLSMVKRVTFFAGAEVLPLKYFKAFMLPNLWEIQCVAKFEDTSESLTLMAFEKLQNAERIYLYLLGNALSKSQLKEFLTIKRQIKLRNCELLMENDVDCEDILKFMGIHMAPKSKISIDVHGWNPKMQDFAQKLNQQPKNSMECEIHFKNHQGFPISLSHGN